HDHEGKPVGYGADGLEDFHQGRVRPVDRDILERVDFRGRSVLDIGCGRGEAVRYAAEQGASAVRGVDFSAPATEIARGFLAGAGIEADLTCADALEFLRDAPGTTRGGSIDVVLMLDCVEHIPRTELTEILGRLLPLMSRRGLLVVNTPA